MKSSVAFIITFGILSVGFMAIQQVMPDACVLPSKYLSKDAMVLAISKGCEIDVSKDPMVKAFSDLKAFSRLSLETLEVTDIEAWLRFSRAQVQLNDTLEYSRDAVINPGQILYRSIEDTKSVKVLALLLASKYCSDGADAEVYEEMVNTFSDKSPETFERAGEIAFYAVQNLGCL